jgi:CRISPR-associated Csx2 family protein
MKTQLASFLGRTERPRGYRTANYVLPDASVQTGSFFGLLLYGWLVGTGARVDRLLLLGTSRSMWDFVAERLHVDQTNEDLFLDLLTALESPNGVDMPLLRRVEEEINKPGRPPVALRLISFGREDAEQVDILHAIGEALDPGDRVIIDVTHGFRHLAMLGLMAAFLLEETSGVKIDGLYYGALDMTVDDRTPVVELSGLLRIARGVAALNRFDASGDYGCLERLLIEGGIPGRSASQLADATFLERSFQAEEAARAVRQVQTALGQIKPRSVAALFLRALRRDLAWTNSTDRAELELSTAVRARRRGLMVEAVAAAMEAMVTRKAVLMGFSPSDIAMRSEAAEALGKETPFFRDLRGLRNALVHGDTHEGRSRVVLQMLRSREELVRGFDELLDQAKLYLRGA